MERAVERAGRDRRRGDRRADQSRRRRRPARPHDGGPDRPRATSATPAMRRRTAALHQRGARARARPAQARRRCSNERAHPVLGRTTVTPTMLEAGVSRNVTPPAAKAVLDIRSTPAWTHEEIAERLANALESDVGRHLAPAGALRDAGRLAAPRAAARRCGPRRKRSAVRPAPTGCSSATPTRSSAARAPAGAPTPPDEYVDLPEVTAARAFYADLGARLPGRGA